MPQTRYLCSKPHGNALAVQISESSSSTISTVRSTHRRKRGITTPVLERARHRSKLHCPSACTGLRESHRPARHLLGALLGQPLPRLGARCCRLRLQRLALGQADAQACDAACRRPSSRRDGRASQSFPAHLPLLRLDRHSTWRNATKPTNPESPVTTPSVAPVRSRPAVAVRRSIIVYLA